MAKIGYALKSLRLRRQLSMRELALRSGVSHTTISMMERDAISPTIDTLQAVLDALGSRLAEFLGGVRQGAGSPFYPAEDMPEIGNPDTISYRLIGLNHPYRSFQFLRESYAVGADTGEMLSHVAQEAGYVVKGRVEVTVGDARRALRAGDGYYFDSRAPHGFRNIGDEPAEVISAISPPSY
ncbi:cupin domain-containing protein [Paracoccus sediminicola]|uniref:cupin domain-containing protein n=1 Tax=Paracoccus sediminicola TaxID=3017783 RepID=UPI0022F056D2|nr:cupin domain-containing protein [Paracoccus sediminicola]WBU55721.1 cupin domain-containing protein [Paracoccus sediminicola]